MNKWLVFLLLCPAMLRAEIYKCQGNGATVFADRPCGSNATPVEVKTDMLGSDMAGGRTHELLEQFDRKNQAQQTTRDIKRYHSEIERLQLGMDAEISALQESRRYSTNSLAGATRDLGLVEEAKLVRQRYQSEIDALRREIDHLRDAGN